MLHNLTIGHLDPSAILQDRKALVRRRLDMAVVWRLLTELGEHTTEGEWRLGAGKVELRDGYLVIPWMGHGTTRLSEEFALRLRQETGCLLADREHCRLVDPEQLQGLNGQAVTMEEVRG